MQHHIISINEYRIDLDLTVLNDLKPFKEEVLNELYNTHKLHGDVPVLFSGGMDSTFIVRSLIELGIKPKTVSFSFTPNNDDGECLLTLSKCKKYGLEPPEFFYIDHDKFYDHVEYLIDHKNIAYPMLHGFFMDYFLKNNKHSKFYSGISCEYKLKDGKVYMPPGPEMVKNNNPHQLLGFTTDRTFLSYFKHPEFVSNYKKPQKYFSTGMVDAWYVRDLVYMNCYPDIDRVPKDEPNPWRQHIKDPFYKHVLPYLIQKYPLIHNDSVAIKPCEFDLDYLVNL